MNEAHKSRDWLIGRGAGSLEADWLSRLPPRFSLGTGCGSYNVKYATPPRLVANVWARKKLRNVGWRHRRIPAIRYSELERVRGMTSIGFRGWQSTEGKKHFGLMSVPQDPTGCLLSASWTSAADCANWEYWGLRSTLRFPVKAYIE